MNSSDYTPPTAFSVQLYGTNGENYLTSPGDILTLSFTASEILNSETFFSALIGSNGLDWVNNGDSIGTEFSFSTTIPSESVSIFPFPIRDMAGNLNFILNSTNSFDVGEQNSQTYSSFSIFYLSCI
jgi:hypothetical protein